MKQESCIRTCVESMILPIVLYTAQFFILLKEENKSISIIFFSQQYTRVYETAKFLDANNVCFVLRFSRDPGQMEKALSARADDVGLRLQPGR